MVLIPESKNLKQELCDKLIQDNLVKENDVIRHSYSNNRMENMRIQNQEYHDCAPTLDTRCDWCGNTSSTCGVLIKEDIRPSLWTAAQAKMITPSGDINRYIDSKIIDKFNDGDCADISFPKGYNKANRVFNGYAPCLNTTTTASSFITKTNLRIRKLTPRECGRLQGVGDDDITIMSKGQSNASLYHLFGDSIEITCLMAIFGELLGLDYIEIIKKFIERNICEHKTN
jgi:site-specific DNA-cytosine methylase